MEVMMYLLEVLNPVAQQRGHLQTTAASNRPPTLDDKTVGLLWNGFRNGDIALKQVGEMLTQRFKGVRTKFYVGGHPTANQVLVQAATESDVVVGAAAD